MKIFITNLGMYNEGYLVGKWVKLPVSEDKLDEVLEAIGINEYYEEFFISDFENERIIGLSEVVSEYSSVQALNELAQRLEELSDDEADKLGAVLEYEACRSVSDVLELLDELDNFDLLTDVNDDEDLGYYYAEEYCSIAIPEHIQPYFNYEAYGRDIRLESSCLYTSYGFLLDNR
ncbi:MAG: antirestriction protein ArdA [Clostridia bacterium]|nr:antirestriction protein ArdA [Clostridia bacterium]